MRVKKLIFGIVVLLGVLFFSQGSAIWGADGENLIPNPGFEKKKKDKPDSWVTRTWHENSPKFEWTDESYKGKKAIKIIAERETDAGFQFPKLLPLDSSYIGKEMVIGGYVKVEDVKGSSRWSYAEIRVEYFNEKGKRVGYYSAATKGTHKYARFTKVHTVPKNTKTFIIQCRLHNASGIVWFDDVFLGLIQNN